MKRRAGLFALTAAALCAGNAHAQIVPFTGSVLDDFLNAITEGVDRAVDPGGQDLALPAVLGDRASGYDIDEVRVSYHAASDTLFVGVRTFGIAGDVDGDGDPGRASPELRALGGVDVPHFGPPEAVAVMFDFDEDGLFDIVAGVPFLGAIDPNDLERGEAAPGDGDGFQVAQFVGGMNAALAPGAAFGGPVDTGWLLHASPNARQPDLEFEIRGFSQLAVDHVSGLDGPDVSNRFAIDVYMGSAGDAVGEDFLHGGFVNEPGNPDDPPPTLCPAEMATPEQCNDFDDDCDEEIDEEVLHRLVDGEYVPFAELDCQTQLPGICGLGTPDCRAGNEICIPDVRPGDRQEICNGVDDDCDGLVDEHTPPVSPLPGVGEPCDSGEPGICGAGIQACVDGELVCPPTSDPIGELCNAEDDDCDGLVDEDFPELDGDCQRGVGECASDGTYVCRADGMGVECDAPEPGDPVAELCNGLDDDCDDEIDETFPDLGVACSVGAGDCLANGVMICADGGMGTVCGAQPAPGCGCGNGVVDDGEQCDDGNDDPTDECAECTLCDGVCDPGDPCVNDCRCGNGVVEGQEACDDGNRVDTDGCTNNCTEPACGDGVCSETESCTSCETDCGPCQPGECGDFKVDGNEECDDGNVLDGDGFSSACTVEIVEPDGGPAPRLTGADLSDNCSTTRPGGDAGWWILLGLPLLLRRRRSH